MTPFIKRAHAYIQRAFDRAKQMAFHALVEVRIRKTVVKSMSRIVDTFNKKADPPSLSQIRATEDKPGIGDREKNTNRRIDEQRGEEIPTPCPSPEPLIPSTPNTLPDSPPQQDVIPNNESRASSEVITKDEITNNDSSASTEDENPFPPVTRKNFYKHPIFWARFFGYAIPLSFLLYVLYLNYLPFGYHKTFTINVGSPDDTKPSEFYLEPSRGLSERKIDAEGNTYRELMGQGKLIFKSTNFLKSTILTIDTPDPGVTFVPPYIDFNPEEINWDLHWDLSKENSEPDVINTNFFYFEGEPYFDGSSRIEMASSSDLYESGPLTIYAKWKPKDSEHDFQQIVGHFNWEVIQNRNNVRFMIGRVDNAEGKFYTADYLIKKPDDFFQKTHTLLAIYQPDIINGNGFIEIFVDGYLGSRVSIGKSVIWNDYNGKKNLSSGKSDHGSSSFFIGNIYHVMIRKQYLLRNYQKIYLTLQKDSKDALEIPIITTATTTIKQFNLHADQQ